MAQGMALGAGEVCKYIPCSMQPKKGLLPALCLLLLGGCDLFSTREFVPKPRDIRPLQGLFRPGDSLVYRVTESLRDAEGKAEIASLAKKRLRFLCLRDSLRGAGGVVETLKVISIRITDDSSGILLEDGLRFLQFGGEGVLLENPGSGGGARFHPLKVSAQPESQALAQSSPQDAFLALPAVFTAGREWRQPMGVLEATRELVEVDTLSYRKRLEEAWRVSETIRRGDQVLSQGDYWYGVSGLIRADQAWGGFDMRSENAEGGEPAELRRKVERL